MASVIKERETPLGGTVYERYDSNNELIQKFGAVGFVKESTEKNKTYFIITDLNGRLIDDANIYLNKTIGDAEHSKRQNAYTALKLFYSFLQLEHYDDPQDITEDDIRNFRLFLEGGQKEGSLRKLDIQRRGNSTFNIYLSVYRDFYKQMYGLINLSIFDTVSIGTAYGDGFLAHAKNTTQEKYKSNKKVAEKQSIPKYIKHDQYEKIIELIEEKYSLREEVIIQLMYKYGLRLGEVLGLTFEDIMPSYLDGKFDLIIRNRISDKPDQKAKGTPSPKLADHYKDSWYTEEGIGYQKVLIEEYMAEMIYEYIDESRDDIILSKSAKKRENLKNKAAADRVGTAPLLNNENQYIFLNHQHYTPLTQGGWNYVLREIFKSVGIQIDKGVKKENLSHRFRHGFAMVMVKKGYQIVELQKALRHASPMSCEAYYNPDDKDKAELLRKNHERLEESQYSDSTK
ncbi:tyrosine-type recombinase/integrase [Siminovitchia sediminis]|uniref:Tyrosine-type recombinase/integrase n=1 Tax=Siminovitchia sediminis TaxID=1274353 RepID=A0ABW4KHV9_9BACI|nr:DNA integration/recombination/invertion protein [Bacillus freudenreichii]